MEPRTARHAALGRIALRAKLIRPTAREAWRRQAEHFFADHDVLVTPALLQPPLRAQAWGRKSWSANVHANTRYGSLAAPWNLACWPAMAVPAGRHPDGTPLSVQLVGRAGGEALLLSVAAQLEQRRPWPRTAPLPATS